MYARAAKVYQQVDLESSSKSKILDRLYLRFLRDCDDAKAAMDSSNVPVKAGAINHANQIIMELVAALDHELAPDLCGNLAALYDYVIDCLMQANMSNDKVLVEQAAAVVSQLREAFLEADSVR
ncbi:MAG: flagellar export chaperone FliS [Kofleriaceae bacterium]|nr:flagellar export chaperone FliS [Kofleriaceae bacterium]